jgi:pimeloyl-ACP methyl ester carboxylesterase
MKNLGRNMDNSFTWNCNIAAIANHYYDLMTFDAIGQSSIRADFIRGQLSDYIMPEDERLIKAFFPHHTIHTVADAGHWVHADNPEGFMQVLTKILLYT